jgi:hypothetical protein
MINKFKDFVLNIFSSKKSSEDTPEVPYKVEVPVEEIATAPKVEPIVAESAKPASKSSSKKPSRPAAKKESTVKAPVPAMKATKARVPKKPKEAK